MRVEVVINIGWEDQGRLHGVDDIWAGIETKYPKIRGTEKGAWAKMWRYDMLGLQVFWEPRRLAFTVKQLPPVVKTF